MSRETGIRLRQTKRIKRQIEEIERKLDDLLQQLELPSENFEEEEHMAERIFYSALMIRDLSTNARMELEECQEE